ncbi:extracellular solute-binding protein [Wenxinia saemankumensis]|uniref:Carbohydrate ABC transporter substrate-binding protein, CUT1 family n=1 Tax=Wenxinia saemankumensis TaxID=1447782 RepID=A0A1M6HFC4_9RHOB|nr:extracellular solute-binding protein [Wenxinia saemankumensis]SHJ20854.1 carbohydrate ABC transporter substrate-binding protein, CUT1 family [Wenxinia saemankumensis]
MTRRLTASTLALALAGAPLLAQEDMVTRDRVGPADAENALTFRLTAYDLYSSDPATSAAFEELFVDFIEDNPGWRIDTQLQTGNLSQEQARMIEQAQAGRGPDCAMVDSAQLATYKAAGILSPMNEYFTEEEIADFFPYVRDGITDEDGNMLAVWWFTDLRVLYRNTEVVPEAPQTWDDLQAAALATVEQGYEGILFNGARGEGTTFDWLANYWALGGELVDEAGEPVFYEGENRELFLQAVRYYESLVDSGAAPARVTSIATYDDMLAAAAASTTAMFVGGNWMYAQLQTTLPEEEAAKWEASELPGPTAEQRATGTGGWTIAALTDDPEKVRMCAGIAKLYLGPGNAFQGLLPTQASLYDEYDTYAGPEFEVFSAALENGRARPGVAIYPEISNQIQILLGEVMSGAAEPEAALDAAAEAVEAAYARQ